MTNNYYLEISGNLNDALCKPDAADDADGESRENHRREKGECTDGKMHQL